MATHSKGKYVAFRSRRNAPTMKELAARRRLIEPSCEIHSLGKAGVS